jgi:type I restriction enzyme S subunit
MSPETFLEKFDLIADAPGAVAKMRELLIHFAICGKLASNNQIEKPVSLPLSGPSPDEVGFPSNWRCGLLGDAFTFEYGDNLPAPKRTETGEYPVYGSNGIVGTHDTYLIEEPSIIVGRKGSAGALNIANGPSWTTDVAYFVRPPKDLDLRFTYYLFSTLRLDELGKGIKPGLSRKEAYALPITVPPLAEQKRIVAKVDELMALCDRLEQQQNEREAQHAALSRASLTRFIEAPTPENLHYLFHPTYTTTPADLRKTILTLAVQGKLVPQDPNDEPAERQLETIQTRKVELVRTKVIKKSEPSHSVDPDQVDYDMPESWAWVRLMDICELITDGTHLTPKYTDSGRMFLSAQNVKPFRFMPAKHRFVSEEHYQGYIKNRKPERGDVLLTRVGAGIGEAATIDQDLDFAIYVSLALIRPVRGLVFSDYITLWLNSPDGTEKSSQNTYGKGVSQGNLNLSLIRNFLVPLPPLAEQKRIVAKVDELMKLVDQLENQLTTARATAENLLNALLADLTSQKAA